MINRNASQTGGVFVYQLGLLDDHIREYLLHVAIQVANNETDDILTGSSIQRLPLEWLVAKCQFRTVLGSGLGDIAARIQVHPAFLDGKGVARLGGNLTGGAQLTSPGDAGDAGELAVAKVQAGAAGLTGVGEGIGAIHSIDGLFEGGAVVLGLEEGGNRLLPVADRENDRLPLELKGEITASAPIGVVHPVNLAGVRAVQVVHICNKDRIGRRIIVADKQVDKADILTADIGAEQGRFARRCALAGKPDRRDLDLTGAGGADGSASAGADDLAAR